MRRWPGTSGARSQMTTKPLVSSSTPGASAASWQNRQPAGTAVRAAVGQNGGRLRAACFFTTGKQWPPQGGSSEWRLGLLYAATSRLGSAGQDAQSRSMGEKDGHDATG